LPFTGFYQQAAFLQMTWPEVIQNGDIFRSKAQTLVNTVNCVGVMGKGIALGFRRRFPTMHDDYVKRCERGEVRLGRPYLYRQDPGPWILNFPTKDHWKSVSNLADIEAGLKYLLRNYKRWGITSIAMPPLGTGNGGLEWHIVGPTLYEHLSHLDIPVELYAPHGTRHAELQPLQTTLTEPQPTNFGRIGPAWVALLEALARLERQPYRPLVGRTLFQKLAYFASALGFDLGVSYSRGSFGPYSPELKRYIGHLINNGLITETRRGNMFEVRLGRTYDAAARAVGSDLQAYESSIERLVDLFTRMRTRDAEVAATVHFAWSELIAQRKEAPSELEIVDAVMAWKRRRNPPVERASVIEATRSLNLLHWIQATPSEGLQVDSDLELLSA
jgi:O-acetyl-ADP-ribose deacetylase (regulator of RNase III)/uncharacterized protein YwgA